MTNCNGRGNFKRNTFTDNQESNNYRPRLHNVSATTLPLILQLRAHRALDKLIQHCPIVQHANHRINQRIGDPKATAPNSRRVDSRKFASCAATCRSRVVCVFVTRFIISEKVCLMRDSVLKTYVVEFDWVFLLFGIYWLTFCIMDIEH